MSRILLVEDSPTQAYTTTKVLERNGYEVIVAEDGQEGLSLAKEESPDLVIMDVVMPNTNGFEATRKLAKDKNTSHIPVIMMSTKDQPTDKIWGLRQGAQTYLVKPVRARELVATVNQLLSKSTG